MFETSATALCGTTGTFMCIKMSQYQLVLRYSQSPEESEFQGVARAGGGSYRSGGQLDQRGRRWR